ncbi:UNVERIFIED_CONTAM: hypothetical protein RMT77_013106 [Armadillidium vulgare]
MCENQDGVKENGKITDKDDTIPVLFSDPEDMEFIFPVKRVGNISSDYMKNRTHAKLTINSNTLKEHNVTKEQIQNAWIEVNSKGEENLVVGNEKFPMEVKPNLIMIFDSEDSKNSISLNMERFNNQSLKDIEGDPSLVPEEPLKVNWRYPQRCHIRSLFIEVTGHKFILRIDDKFVKKITDDADSSKNKSLILHKNEGLILGVVNPQTCQMSLDTIASTSDITGYRDLLWNIKSVSNGRIIVMVSLKDGSVYFDEKARQKFRNLGSRWSASYFYADTWVNVFIKGGKTLQEAFSPNLGFFNTSGSPIEINLNLNDSVDEHMYDCPSWPSSERWEARKIFCQYNDGFSSLCDCDNPLEFEDSFNMKSHKNASENFIPIIIMAGNRTRHLFHLLEGFRGQNGVTKNTFLLVSDGQIENVTRLAFVLGLELLVHRPEGEGVMHISRNLRFALYNALKKFPKAKSFIILEDDLRVSPDFYLYMKQLEPIFEMDETVFCVNAFNHYSYPHTSFDVTLTYRVKTYPAYGWMISRAIVEEILPKWFPPSFKIEWDYLLGTSIIQKDRECIIPDVNRSYHWASGGVHFSAFFSEVLYMSRTLNQNPNVVLKPLQRLIKENYEKEFINQIKRSKPVRYKTKFSLDKFIGKRKILAIYISRQNESDESSFRKFAEDLGIWIYDARDNHNNAWRIMYRNTTILVIGVPLSPYSSYMPKKYKILQENPVGFNRANVFLRDEIRFRKNHQILTRFNYSNTIHRDSDFVSDLL